jgi:hypothetical protein
MLDAMGMYLLMIYSTAPVTINAITRFIKGILFCSSTAEEQQFAARSPAGGNLLCRTDPMLATVVLISSSTRH